MEWKQLQNEFNTCRLERHHSRISPVGISVCLHIGKLIPHMNLFLQLLECEDFSGFALTERLFLLYSVASIRKPIELANAN